MSVRLACVKHAASVHPEPGSNSHVKKFACQYFIWLTVLGLKIRIFFRSQFLNLLKILSIDAVTLRIFKVALLFICQGSFWLFLTYGEGGI